MFVKTKPFAAAKLENGADIFPVLSMEDEHGGRAHVWLDDGCYVIGLMRTVENGDDIVKPITHIFNEMFLELKELPSVYK